MNERHRRTVESGYVQEAGFEIRYAEPRTGGGTGDESETRLWVLARKRSREGAT